MKNFYDLIKSDDIRDYCQKIGYVPNTLQCLDLVYTSEQISLNERHRLYEEIMASMPEPPLPESVKKRDRSLYELLKEHIELESRFAQKFMKYADNPVYRLNFWKDKSTPLNDIFDRERDWDFDDDKPLTVWNMLFQEEAIFLNDGTFSRTYIDDDFIYVFFEYYITPLPIPFKRGDIVCFDDGIDKYKPCIFDSIYDIDMVTYAKVYSCDDRAGCIMKKSAAYSNLNYFSGEYYHYDKFIKVLADYFQKKTDIVTLLNSYAISLLLAKRDHLDDFHFIEKKYLDFMLDD